MAHSTTPLQSRRLKHIAHTNAQLGTRGALPSVMRSERITNGGLKVGDIMTSDVATTTPSEPAQVAWEHMRERGVHHLVAVVDGEVVGIISANDLGGKRRPTSRRMGRTVGELMTRDAVTASPKSTVRAAAKLMLGESIGCLPILDRGALVGIVTVSDLLARIAGTGAHDLRRSASPAPAAAHGPSV